MKLDKEKVRELADVAGVLDHIGKEYHRKGRSLGILCPNPEHGDRHFGNCNIDEETGKFYCFRCGASGDIFTLVMMELGCSFGQAVEIVAASSGVAPEQMSAKRMSSKEYELIRKMPDKADLKLLGLWSDEGRNGVYAVKEIRSPYDKTPLEKGEISEWYPDAEDGYCVISQLIDKNPLQSLLRDNEPEFRALIRNKARETAEAARAVITAIMAAGGFAGLESLQSELERKEARSWAIYAEYDGKPENIPQSNMFAGLI